MKGIENQQSELSETLKRTLFQNPEELSKLVLANETISSTDVELLLETIVKNGMSSSLFSICQQIASGVLLSVRSLVALAEIAFNVGAYKYAAHCLMRAHCLSPLDADPINFLGILAKRAGELGLAAQWFDQALRIDSNHLDAAYNRATLYCDSGKFWLAIKLLTRLLKLAPDFNQARLLLGKCYLAGNRLAAAGPVLFPLLRIMPQDIDVWRSMHVFCLRTRTDLRRHLALLKAGEVRLGKRDCLSREKADVYLRMGDLARAATYIGRSLSPIHFKIADWGFACFNLFRMGSFGDCLCNIELALRCATPEESRELRITKAMLSFSFKLYPEAWNDYACRDTVAVRRHQWLRRPQPRNLRGLSVLLYGEQGIGDQILFSGMLPDLLNEAKSVTLVCSLKLAPLLQRSFPEIRIVPSPAASTQLSRDAYDWDAPLGDLGSFYRLSEDKFPRRTYLKADTTRSKALRDRLSSASNGRLTVGISTVTLRNRDDVPGKVPPTEAFTPLLRFKSAMFVSLEYGPSVLKAIASRVGCDLVEPFGVDCFSDLEGTAALISQLDLVITVSNTVAHLAGALGVEVWLIRPKVYPLIWLTNSNEYSPWYLNVRQYLQNDPSDWVTPISALCVELSTRTRMNAVCSQSS